MIRRFLALSIAVCVSLGLASGCSTGPGLTGTVTGFIVPCGKVANPIRGAAGVVAVTRSHAKHASTQRQHVGRDVPYRFVLSPGNYELNVTYDDAGVPATHHPVTVSDGRTQRIDVGAICK